MGCQDFLNVGLAFPDHVDSHGILGHGTSWWHANEGLNSEKDRMDTSRKSRVLP